MDITKDGRHEYSKKRRKLVRKGLNPYDDALLTNLDKEWAQLRVRISSIKHIKYGTLTLMKEFEDSYYRELNANSDMERIMYEINKLRDVITEPQLVKELDEILAKLSDKQTKGNLIHLKRMIVRLQASANLPIHFYEALDDEYQAVYQDVMNDSFKRR